MKSQRDIASFVLRFTQDLWQDSKGEPHVEWRGHIRHVQDDQEAHFTDVAEAMAFIQKALMKLTMDATPTGNKSYQDKAMRESFKLWERFAESYTTMVFGTVQQTMRQTEALQKQVNQAVGQAMRPWWLLPWSVDPRGSGAAEPAVGEPGEVLAALAALHQQIADLTAKIADLQQTIATARATPPDGPDPSSPLPQ